MANFKSKLIKRQTNIDPALVTSIPAWALKDKIVECQVDSRTILEKYGYNGTGKK